MNLYSTCLSVVNTYRDQEKMLLEINTSYSLIKQPSNMPSDKKPGRYYSVYYISDIHLEHQIIRAFPNGATNEQIEEFICSIISNILSDDVVSGQNKWPVLFGGDIASDFSLATLFYSKLIEIWNTKSYEIHERKKASIIPLLQEQQIIEEELSQWKNAHNWTQRATKDLVEYSDRSVPVKIKKQIIRERELDDLIYDEVKFNTQYYLDDWVKPSKSVFVVLGNHEFWGFESYDACVDAYRELFHKLGIEFLNNNGGYLQKKDEKTYWTNSIAIIGGTGFSGYNKWHNANTSIYSNAISFEQEVQLTKKWEDFYLQSVREAQEEQALLIVLTHTPPESWCKQKKLDGNCIYFYGHNHRNTSYYVEESNTYIFADNQIGYYAGDVALKKATIWSRTNPFAKYDDGVYLISLEDYLQFNWYSCIRIEGTKRIEKRLKNGALFYLVKEKGYYGFFIVCDEPENGSTVGTFICAGGKLIRLSNSIQINYFISRFSEMVDAYLSVLSPYRSTQEKISGFIKSFGGTGKIHGYIIDIDYYNHIMLNPVDGMITFYTSPEFGIIKTYNNLQALLSENNPVLLKGYLEQSKATDNTFSGLIPFQIENNSGFTSIDIKNSPYAGSIKMNQLQRLFDAKVLRDWDEYVLDSFNDQLTFGKSLLPE